MSAEPSNDASLSPPPASASEVCSRSLLLDDDDDDDDDELQGDAARVASSVALGVLWQCVEHGVVERLVDPISNLGVSQQQDEVQSGVPCVEHIINDKPADGTLTND